MIAKGMELRRHIKGNTTSQRTMEDKVMAESRPTEGLTEIASAGSRRNEGRKK